MDWRPEDTEAESPADSDLGASLQTVLNALHWLPGQIELRDIRAQLPCSKGRCTLDGEVELLRLDDALQLNVRLLRENHSAVLQAHWQGLDGALDSPRELQMTLHLDEQQQMELRSDLAAQGDALQWNGNLLIAALQEITWVATWLSEWTSLDTANLPATPQQAGVIARWQLQVPQTA